MINMKLGILGTADIAFRRFLPALSKCPQITYAGVASRTPEKGLKFQENFGGKVYESYDALLADESIDAVYVPLPPALHFEWGKKVLNAGKHLFMEKPFTTKQSDTKQLLELPDQKGLKVHENYMFLYHSQLAKIKEMIADGSLGDIRLYKMSFGFPMRGQGDFRYNKELGGGALLDCGGYPVRLALELLGNTAKVVHSKLVQPNGFEVDLYGSAVMENDVGEVAQISFGMDNAYQCQLEVWGSKATLIAPRIFTAGDGIKPTLILRTSFDESKMELDADDQFLHSIEEFVWNTTTIAIQSQASLVSNIQNGVIYK
ncbi:MAG TPA: Gfo/Idh/MocA family oxidoreductase [Candidatus Butyricicoccus avistercoris]|uniref:Gfo/Idh/MocA family oxidoreductase n=1 Tax=Candidatus Butyricicoccus avistercoris TaxID=2838518 RepID=A0A9D1THL9_9FIRM|nr:Gfo/Idh/MocA family oxidoreductase [Candidatus Butyricicoccus avistercoris]